MAPALSKPAAAQVLLDGNFLHACQLLKCALARRPTRVPHGADTFLRRRSLGDVREAVAKLLGATCRVFVTKCVQAELRALGADYAGTWARQAHARPRCRAGS
jgi:rRNA-processing protein FCF1